VFFFIFVLLYKYFSYLSTKKSETFPTDSCVNGLSDLIFQIGESCSPLLPRAAGENTRKTGFLHTKAYKSKKKKNFSNFFRYSQRRGIHVHHVKKSTFYLYSKCTFFAAKIEGAILCACVILCASETISRSKIGDS
jgi:hypothetical protein